MSEKINVINVADLVDPDDLQGRTYREINVTLQHNLSVGDLVEVESGVRLFIVHLGRDCDQTPLYWLAPRVDSDRVSAGWIGGYPEEDVKLIRKVVSR